MAKLSLISVPIGNLKDITQRALEYLENGKHFVVEDTRTFKKLLEHYGIDMSDKQIYSFHDQSKDSTLESLGRLLNKGVNLSLVSEAGSPIISDPAFPLVRLAVANDHEIESISGISSVIVALELSGLPPHPFIFHGFLARTSSDKKQYFDEKLLSGYTHLFFESPHRIVDSLKLLASRYPDCDIAICRELTKMYESVYRFKASDYESALEQMVIKGEIVLVIHLPKDDKKRANTSRQVAELAAKCLEQKGKVKTLSKLLAEILGEDPKKIYNSLIVK